MPAPYSWSFTDDELRGPCPCTVLPPTATPETRPRPTAHSVELGMKFRPTPNGYITGVRFYKGADEHRRPHAAPLWSAPARSSRPRRSPNESATGWQQVNFSTVRSPSRPTPPTSSRTTRRSATTPSPRRAHERRRQRAAARARERRRRPERRLRLRRRDDVPGRPTATTRTTGSTPSTPRRRTPPPTVTASTPATGATGVADRHDGDGAVRQAGRRRVRQRRGSTDSAGTPVPSSVSFDARPTRSRSRPRAPLNAAATYTVTVSGATDHGGRADGRAVHRGRSPPVRRPRARADLPGRGQRRPSRPTVTPRRSSSA